MWKNLKRPGFFGRNRDKIIADLNSTYGISKWHLIWKYEDTKNEEFHEACLYYYEFSYVKYLEQNKQLLEQLSEYGECYDNAITNIQSGCDYNIQEAYSTHIQDIAVRNCMKILGYTFNGPQDKLLQIRHKEGLSTLLSPGFIPFYNPTAITQPSKCPQWANKGSVEDFWQSNKWIQIWEHNTLYD